MRHSLFALPVSLLVLTATALENHHLIHDALHNQQPYVHHRDISRDAVSNPCGVLSEVFGEGFIFPGLPVMVDVRPSVAIACLRSVPVDRERDLRLISYLRPYLSFQSTIETLADPPDEYLLHGVDIWRGLDEIEARLKGLGYSSQYDVMMDLQSIFVAANDNHFDYPPAILSVFFYVRRYLDFISISKDGISPPEIYHRIDIEALGGHSSYEPSPVDSVDDMPIVEWLAWDASRRPANYRDPDAQFNSEFTTIPGMALSRPGMSQVSQIEVPDNYTIMFRNETGFRVDAMLMFAPGVNFSGIDSGEAFHERFELVPDGAEDLDDPGALDISQAPSIPGLDELLEELKSELEGGDKDKERHITGYPVPVALHSQNSISGYLLDDPDHQDTAVLAILDFYPVLGSMLAGSHFNITGYILESRAVVAEFVRAAKEDGRTRLVIDMSANSGGAVLLSHEIYRLLFPQGDLSIYDRYRINEAFEAAAVAADYDIFLSELITAFKPQSPDGDIIDTAEEFIGPYTAGGQNVTAPFRRDLSTPWAHNIWVNGFEPDPSLTTIDTAPFDPENITIITDGTCASACASFVDFLTRNHGIRTIALGGRPDKLPMQAVGGVRGTLLTTYTELRKRFAIFTTRAFTSPSATPAGLRALSDAVAWTPSFHRPPLLPLAGGQGDTPLGLGIGKVNARNGYAADDLDGVPLHFKYDAAHCRLFYTQRMAMDVTEAWRRAAGVAWRGEKCVEGSAVGENSTMGSETVGFSADVRTRVRPGTGPGALPPKW